MASPRTIFLRPPEELGHHYDEARVVTAAVKPGMLCEFVGTVTGGSSGTFPAEMRTLKPHATAGGKHQRIIAIEDALQGRTADDAYAVGELCRFVQPQQGDMVWLRLKDGQNCLATSYLESNGDGTVRVAGTPNDKSLAQAEEALDLSAAGADGWVRARII